MADGRIFNIMKYSIHDGPGIRTTVFLQGCPLSCEWCHNPESQFFGQALMFSPERCIGCGQCLEVCPHGAIRFSDGQMRYDRERCRVCGACAKVCHSGARELVSREVSTSEVLAEIEKDLIFYDESGGGVTFSGGEALMQPGFLRELLLKCRQKEIHTAVETCGFVKREYLEEIAPYVNLFLYDLKHMDNQIHRRFTNAPNELILENLRWLVENHKGVVIRIPIIPGVNDDQDNIRRTGEFVASLKRVSTVHILPYHKAGAEKYRRLGLSYKLPGLEPPSQEHMQEIKALLEEYGMTVKIGG